MWIKSNRFGSSRLRLRTAGSTKRLAVLLAYSGLVFLGGVLAHRAGWIRAVTDLGRQVSRLPAAVAAWTVDVEHMDIDIKLDDYLEISRKRDEALESRLLVASADDFVPGSLRVAGDEFPVRLRLKGDLQDHWEGPKWSLRIRLRGGRALWGMTEFSIQDPRTRSYLSEWLYHHNLRREGLPALRYTFVDVAINGESKGIYALEEHVGKQLVERAELREGPIVRFNEEASWLEVRDQGWLTYSKPNALSGSGSYLASPIDGFDTTGWTEDEGKRLQYLSALHLLEEFRRGSRSPREIFDLPKLAKLFAVSDLHGAAHATSWRNCRFYYNPVTSLLEPIGFDGTSNPPPVRGILPMWPALIKQAGFYRQQYYDSIFADLAFYEEYIGALERVSRPGYLENLLADLRSDLEHNERILRRDYPSFTFSPLELYENRRYIRSVLNPPRLIQATLEEESPESIDVEVGNLQILPVELLQLVVDGSTIPLSEPIVLPGRPFDSLVELRRVRFGLEGAKLEEVDPEAEIDLEHRILGMQDVRREPVAPWNWLSQGISPNLARQEADFRDRPAIEVDDQRREIRFLPGRWVITRDVIVPEGFTLVAGPGTQLELDNASILSRSPVLLTGSVEDPVVLKTGESMTGSLVVLQTETVSLLENVVFDSLTSPLDPGLNITGAVTFYEAPVTVKRCYFRRARAEDALNLIRSRFEISESRFDQADSDALDIDFSDGLLIGTEFLSPTNDGVDISGSVVRMSDIRISGAGDKAVSVGEASRLLGGGLEISASQVAIASKDLSQVVLLTVTIDSAQIGLAAYQKKPEFGPASIEVESLGLKDVVDPYWVEIGSWVTVDGKTTAGTLSDPKPVFYPEG